MRDQAQPSAPLADATTLRFAVVVSRFNETITGSLRDAAAAALREAHAASVEILAVPGAFEVPQAARAAAETGRFDAIVCLGCIIRGETPHFDYIAAAVAHGITDAAGDTGVPMAFGVLTTDTLAQATARSGPGPDNKGLEAAAAAIEMASLYRALATPQKSAVRIPRMSSVDGPARHRAREAALQMLYQTEVGGASAHEAVRTYWPGRDAPPSPDDEHADGVPEVVVDENGRIFANGLVAGTVARVAEIDELIGAHLKNWRIARTAIVDRLILRLGIYELLTETDTPAKVIINESLELARTFSGEEPVPFINGVLDAVRKTLGRD